MALVYPRNPCDNPLIYEYRPNILRDHQYFPKKFPYNFDNSPNLNVDRPLPNNINFPEEFIDGITPERLYILKVRLNRRNSRLITLPDRLNNCGNRLYPAHDRPILINFK